MNSQSNNETRSRSSIVAARRTARRAFTPDVDAVIDLLATVRARQLRGEPTPGDGNVRYLSEHGRGSESRPPHRRVPEVA